MRIDLHIHFEPPANGDENLLRAIFTQGTHIMATLKDLQDALNTLATDIAAEKTEVSGELKTLTDQVAALQAQIAAGGTVTSADLDGLLAQINVADAAVKDISTPVATPSV